MEFISIENGRAIIKLGRDDMNDVIQCFAKEISDLELFGANDEDKRAKRERLTASRKLLDDIYNDVKAR